MCIIYKNFKFTLKHKKYILIKILLFFFLGLIFISHNFIIFKTLSSENCQSNSTYTPFLVKVHTIGSNLRTPGTGIIIKNENINNIKHYIVVTNNHVILSGSKFKIETIDGSFHTNITLKKLENPDLAILEFSTNKNYSVAKLVPDFSLGRLNSSQYVFAVGYPIDSDKIETIRGHITLLLPRYIGNGFQIGFDIPLRQGMSGGALLNCSGKVVGILGRGFYPNTGFGSSYQTSFKTEAGINILTDAFPKERIINSSWAIPVEVIISSNIDPRLAGILIWNNLSSQVNKPKIILKIKNLLLR